MTQVLSKLGLISTVFLISLYGTSLSQRGSYLALHGSLWASGIVNYDYILTNSINCLLIGSRCIPNDAHTNHFWANLVHASKYIKTSRSVLSYTSLFWYRTVSMSNCEWPRHNCKTISSNSRYQFLIVGIYSS